MANKRNEPKPGSHRGRFVDHRDRETFGIQNWDRMVADKHPSWLYTEDGNQGSAAQSPMKMRMKIILAYIRSQGDRGVMDRYVDPKVLKKLLKDGSVVLRRSRNSVKNYTDVVATEFPLPVQERVAEPYKKRNEDMDAAGLNYRGKIRGEKNE